MSGQLPFFVGGGGIIAKPFTISCSNASDCGLTLQLTTMQPDALTNVQLEIIAFGTDSNGAQNCLPGQVLSAVITVQGGPGINQQVSNGTFCAAVLDIGNLHQTQTVTVTGQVPG
jgi:hypothetical protein